jgi:hypothetical protein
MNASFEHDGVRVTLANTIRAEMAYDLFDRRLPHIEDSPRYENMRKVFVLIAAYTSNAGGLDWQPPTLFADDAQLAASLEQFYTAVSVNVKLLNVWVEAIQDLLAPQSRPEDRETADDPLAQPAAALAKS